MAKGKDHHVFVCDEGNDDHDGTEGFPVKTIDAAKRIMVQRGYDKCTGIRVLSGKVLTSPCGQARCGSCTKANGRRLCPGDGCDKWISVSAKQHSECGWRKPEVEKKVVAQEYVYRADDHHGFEKLKRKIMTLARQAAMQYGWDGIIMGYAAKVGRGGSTARITFVSPQNELYTIDERGGLKVQPGLDEHLTVNAENALTLIRQRICPNVFAPSADRSIKHEGHLLGDGQDLGEPHHHHHHHHHHGMPVQGPELPPGMEDKQEMPPELHHMHWLHHQAVASEKRAAELSELEKAGVPPPPAAMHAAMLTTAQHMHLQQVHMQAMQSMVDPLHLPMEPSALSLEDHKRKQQQQHHQHQHQHHHLMMDAMHKRPRHDE